MTSIRKFAYAAVLAVSTFSFAPNLALAQEPARGKFTLSHDVRWGTAKVPAGDYEFSYDPNSVVPVLTLRKMSGTRAGFIVIVPTTEDSKPSDLSRIVLESSPEGIYVSAMRLPESGMTLLFHAPPHSAERQVAKLQTRPRLRASR